MPYPRSTVLVAMLLGIACRTGGPASPPAVPAARAAAVEGQFSAAVRWVRASAEHRAVFLEVYRWATAHVEREAATLEPGTWGVVVDADETVIDNTLYQVEREREGLPFSPESWRAWTQRREAVPLPGALAFLSRVRALGGRIAVVTNRREAECPDTEAVFRAHGLAWDVMLCRPDQGPGDKTGRLRAVERGTTGADLPPLEIVAIVGDNIQDFPGATQAIRDESDAAFAEFGGRFFMLPNPMYGSWE